MSIRDNLYRWRDLECEKKGIEAFRVLPNTTLDEIVLKSPKTKEELCSVKGIKEMKFAQYGSEILKIVNGESLDIKEPLEKIEEKSLSVSQFLNNVNNEISKIHSRVKGEVVTFQISGSAVYFTIKDTDSEASLSVFMWTSDYSLSNIKAAAGLEVIVEGRPEIYKPNGRFSLRASTIELVGEGALKAAYEKLKNDLSNEGLFDTNRKVKINDYPTKIGVITSKQGAVIHDFLNNLGKFGYEVLFMDSRVEGVLAIKDLLYSINKMSKLDIDVLVIIRGGGSLESLQAFNNEHVVRAISNCKVPVICAIGHDKDVPLAQMASDYSPSTPSMCTAILNESWNESKYLLTSYEKIIFSGYEGLIQNYKNIVERSNTSLNKNLFIISTKISSAINSIQVSIKLYDKGLSIIKKEILYSVNSFLTSYSRAEENFRSKINQIGAVLDAYDPLRQLKLGYSLIYLDKMLIKSTKQLKEGDKIEAEFSDGKILANIVKIDKHDQKRN